MQLLEPGIYQNIPAVEYHALPYVSNSYLKRMAKCPANAKVTMQDDTPALIIGRAAHVFILEGDDAFHSEFAILPDNAPKRPTDRQIYAKKPSPETVYSIEYWNHFTAISNGKSIITNDDYAMLSGMRFSVRSHPFAKMLLTDGVSETTVIFDTTVNGRKVRCKCRPDRTPSLEMMTLLDLKTTEDADENAFLRSCIKWGYITQAAFYIDGYNTVRDLPMKKNDQGVWELDKNAKIAPEMDAFAFIAVEKKEPYRCEVYAVDMDFLMWGREEYQRLLKIEAQCQTQGFYPNYQNAGAGLLLKPAWLV
jgi:exodeoxyribonuclease VIII